MPCGRGEHSDQQVMCKSKLYESGFLYQEFWLSFYRYEKITSGKKKKEKVYNGKTIKINFLNFLLLVVLFFCVFCIMAGWPFPICTIINSTGASL